MAFLFWKGVNEVTAQSGEKVKGARRTKLRKIRQTCKRLYLRAGQCDQGTGRQRSHHRTLSSATSHSGLLQRGKTTPCLHTLAFQGHGHLYPQPTVPQGASGQPCPCTHFTCLLAVRVERHLLHRQLPPSVSIVAEINFPKSSSSQQLPQPPVHRCLQSYRREQRVERRAQQGDFSIRVHLTLQSAGQSVSLSLPEAPG